jgi:hypothetical protein
MHLAINSIRVFSKTDLERSARIRSHVSIIKFLRVIKNIFRIIDDTVQYFTDFFAHSWHPTFAIDIYLFVEAFVDTAQQYLKINKHLSSYMSLHRDFIPASGPFLLFHTSDVNWQHLQELLHIFLYFIAYSQQTYWFHISENKNPPDDTSTPIYCISRNRTIKNSIWRKFYLKSVDIFPQALTAIFTTSQRVG